MKVFQVHYTSCRRGQSTSSGFQVRSATPGLSPNELLDIARLGNYRPPSRGRGRGDGGGLPVALRCVRLPSQRYALIHSCYSGRDYSGREGNFMAHTLVTENGPFPARSTDYLGWTGWQRHLPPEQDTMEPPAPLPMLEVSEIAVAPADGRAFVTARPNGAALLVDLMTCLMLVRSTGRRVVIRETADAGWRWIACLLELLPLATAVEVAISTYQFGHADTADVNATVDGSEFTFGPSERDHEFFVFEPALDLRPVLPDRDQALLAGARRYAETVVAWHLHDPARLQRFAAFMASFKTCPPDESLARGLAMYRQSDARDQAGREKLGDMLEFARAHTRPGDWSRSLRILLEGRAAGGAPDGFDDAGEIIRVCLAVDDRTDRPALAAVAFEAWFSMLLCALEDPVRYGPRVNQCWTEIATRFRGSPGLGRLDGSHVERLRRRIGTDPKAISLVAPYLVQAIHAAPAGAAIHPALRELARAAAGAAMLPAVVSQLATAPDIAAVIDDLDTMDLPGDGLRSQQVESLSDLRSRNPALAWAVRRLLLERGRSELLVEEFTRMLADDDPRGTYDRYMRAAAAAIPDFHAAMHRDLARPYWDSLSAPARARQAWDWLGARSMPMLDTRLLGDVTTYASQLVPIDPRRHTPETVASRIDELVVAQQIKLRPDRPAIRRVLGQVASMADKRPPLAELAPLLAGLDGDEYGVALDVVFQALAAAVPAHRHLNLLEPLLPPLDLRTFVTAYRSAIKRALVGGKRQGEMPALIAGWIGAETSGPLGVAARPVLAALAGLVAARRDGEIAELIDSVRRLIDCGPRDPHRQRALQRFADDVREQQSPLSRAILAIGQKIRDGGNWFRDRR
ncbi:MAG: hypothetical protein ABSG76_12905 [Xanthobacteraceae bacterium]